MGPKDAWLQQAVESLLEDERLRSNLTDAEAAPLLAWAESRLQAIASSTPAGQSKETRQRRLDQGLKGVRTAVQGTNDLVAERARLDPQGFKSRLTALLAPGRLASPSLASEIDRIVAQQKNLSNEALLSRLTTLLPSAPDSGSRPSSERTRHKNRPAPGVRTGEQGRVSSTLLVIILIVVLLAVAASRLDLFPTAPPRITSPASPSTSSGGSWYQVQFTSPRYPDNPADRRGGLDEQLTAFINSATASVDMAIYQLDLENVTRALIEARKRGANVRVVTDIDILEDARENPSFKKLEAEGITVVGGNPNAIMHNKFVVVDGKAVWTGSWNFTQNDTYRYNNNAVLIQSAGLARNYTATFEKMWRDRQFGAGRKAGGATPAVSVSSVNVESYFAPEDKVSGKLVSRLAKALRSIDFMAYSFTDDAMGNAVRERARAGVKVRGVFETTGSETQFSEYGKMKAEGLGVLQDGNRYLMHHKVFIIDGVTVELGSYNFSQNANTSNDENLLIVDDQSLASQFTAEFERVYKQARP